MQDPSTGEIGGLFAGAVGLLVAIGHGLRWWFGWTDRKAARAAEAARAEEATRTRKLDAWHKELEGREHRLDERQDEYQRSIEGQLAAVVRWAAQLQDEHAALRNAYQVVASAMRVKDPRNPALMMADELLKAAIPLEPQIPPEVAHLLARIPEPPPKT